MEGSGEEWRESGEGLREGVEGIRGGMEGNRGPWREGMEGNRGGWREGMEGIRGGKGCREAKRLGGMERSRLGWREAEGWREAGQPQWLPHHGTQGAGGVFVAGSAPSPPNCSSISATRDTPKWGQSQQLCDPTCPPCVHQQSRDGRKGKSGMASPFFQDPQSHSATPWVVLAAPCEIPAGSFTLVPQFHPDSPIQTSPNCPAPSFSTSFSDSRGTSHSSCHHGFCGFCVWHGLPRRQHSPSELPGPGEAQLGQGRAPARAWAQGAVDPAHPIPSCPIPVPSYSIPIPILILFHPHSILSHPILSCPILFHSHPVLPHPILSYSHFILSHIVLSLSHPIQSCPIPVCLIPMPSYPIWSHPICPIPFHPFPILSSLIPSNSVPFLFQLVP